MTTDGTDLVLKYDHNIIDHLGLKLYQNRPTNVIAELVSNSWDADAEKVWITTQGDRKSIYVIDNGSGMDLSTLRTSYLVIGKPKRSSDSLDETTTLNRRLMGRKGIGKLAPFGIAGKLTVATAAKVDGTRRFTALTLDLSRIRMASQDADGEPAVYKPVVHCTEGTRSEFSKLPDPTGAYSAFLKRIGSGTGTLILLRSLTVRRRPGTEALIASLGRRFTVTLARPDFVVAVDDTKVTESSSMPEFELRIPASGEATDTIGDRRVTYWVGFVGRAEWPQSESGVGVYAHGKIGQDRPFHFGVKGKEIFARYMYGVVEADWLDELDEDVISTDRTSINWENPDAESLHEWGARKVKEWVSAYERHRRDKGREENEGLLRRQRDSGAIPKVTNIEQQGLVGLLEKVTPACGKNESLKESISVAVVNAWTHKPARQLIRETWDELAKDDAASTPELFGSIVGRISESMVPEALSLAVTFAQRAYALSVLYNLVHRGREVDLQQLTERFPWILRPDMEMLTADQPLKSVVLKAEEDGLLPTGRRENVAGVPERNKPDFVFLSDGANKRLVVVELKNPRHDLTLENRAQLIDYLTYLEAHYPESDRCGFLIGSGEMSAKHSEITVKSWTDVFTECRFNYVGLMHAMLAGSSPSADDSRVEQIAEYGGEESWELLKKMSDRDGRLRELFDEFGDAS